MYKNNIEAADDKDIANLLRLRMSDISEYHYCAGWLMGLEYTLWYIMAGGSPRFGLGDVAPEKIAELKRLSIKCGGWWHWSDEANGEVFIKRLDWIKLYEEHHWMNVYDEEE